MIYRIAIIVLLLALTGPSWAIVTHDDSVMPEADRPVDALLGQWGTNASCVVIGPSVVLTTTHQGSAYEVIIEGVTYDAGTIAYGGYSGSEDIRVARLTLNGEVADLGHWIPIYTGDTTGQTAVLGGYGRSRNATLTTSRGKPYGYTWRAEPNDTLRWGQNLLEDPIAGRLIARFDGPGTANLVPYEAAVAEYDSGGGWFIRETGQWFVAGLSSGAEHAGLSQSWFASSTSASPDPDRLEAIQLTYHIPWIESVIAAHTPAIGDADRDGDIDGDDLANLAVGYGQTGSAGWSRGNFDGDGDVDLVDLGMLAAEAEGGLSTTDE